MFQHTTELHQYKEAGLLNIIIIYLLKLICTEREKKVPNHCMCEYVILIHALSLHGYLSYVRMINEAPFLVLCTTLHPIAMWLFQCARLYFVISVYSTNTI